MCTLDSFLLYFLLKNTCISWNWFTQNVRSEKRSPLSAIKFQQPMKQQPKGRSDYSFQLKTVHSTGLRAAQWLKSIANNIASSTFLDRMRSIFLYSRLLYLHAPSHTRFVCFNLFTVPNGSKFPCRRCRQASNIDDSDRKRSTIKNKP